MELSVRRNFSLKPKHIAIVQRRVERENLGDRGYSIALRKILEEWERMNEIAQRMKETSDQQ